MVFLRTLGVESDAQTGAKEQELGGGSLLRGPRFLLQAKERPKQGRDQWELGPGAHGVRTSNSFSLPLSSSQPGSNLFLNPQMHGGLALPEKKETHPKG